MSIIGVGTGLLLGGNITNQTYAEVAEAINYTQQAIDEAKAILREPENGKTSKSEFPIFEGIMNNVFPNASTKLNTTNLNESEKATFREAEKLLTEAAKNKGVRNGTIQSSGPLQILSSNSYIDEAGYFHVVGEVQNNSPTSAQFVQVTGTFYDNNNQVVGTQFTYTNPSDIGSGQKAPFDLTLLSASIPVSQIDHYNLAASSQ